MTGYIHMRPFHTVLIMLLLLTTGCTAIGPRIIININALAANEALSKTKYLLISGDSETGWGDLLFEENAQMMMTALQASGFQPAASIDEVEIVILMTYGIGDPLTKDYAFELPVYGQTGVASSQTQSHAMILGNTINTRSTTTYTPSYGVTGHQRFEGSTVSYVRHLFIVAFDYATIKEGRTPSELLKTIITSAGPSNDLRRVTPYLISAGAPYFGRKTNGVVETELSAFDERANALNDMR